jgi:hypothetical protein
MVGMTMTSTTVGTTMASTTAGTTMGATAIAGHINHGHDKHGRGIPKAGFYLYFASPGGALARGTAENQPDYRKGVKMLYFYSISLQITLNR